MTAEADRHIAAEFGRRLADHRRAAGLTQEALAERAGLHAVTISYLETGIRAASVPTLVRVADALGVAPGILVDGIPPTDKSTASG